MFNTNDAEQNMTKYIQLDDWIFEVKTVRALRVKDYGQPYSAIANININGDTAFIDGLIMREKELFSRKDFNTFVKFCRNLELKSASFDRFKNGKLSSEIVNLQKQSTALLFQLAN